MALRAIYGDCVEGEAGGPWKLQLEGCSWSVEALLPTDYPSASAPTPVIEAPLLADGQLAALAAELVGLYNAAPGCECVFQWAEHLREAIEVEEPSPPASDAALARELQAALDLEGGEDEAPADAALGRAAAPCYGARIRHADAEVDERCRVEVLHGEPFHPPKGGPAECFQAHAARVTSMGQVRWVLAELLSDRRVARATHNMLAYRFVDAARPGVLVSDNDDDGESSSGQKLASLLELTGATDVLVVVSRWFGGVHLGPARFKFIASTAGALLAEAGLTAERGRGRPRAKQK